MSIVQFLKSKTFFKHLALMALSLVLLVFIAFMLLKVFTKHGQARVVPNFIGLQPEALENMKEARGFDFVIVDSVFDDTKPKGSIVDQDPYPDEKVKSGRKVYLTVIAKLPERVSMPDLKDLTLRQATAVLETYGLKVGVLRYVPDIARNAVLGQYHKGQVIEPGTQIEKKSVIDLVLGQGTTTERIELPLLIAKKRSEAIKMLHSMGLNVGKEVYLDGNDTTKARVFRQSPSLMQRRYVNMGDAVDLWYRSSSRFNFDDYLKKYQRDSLSNINNNESE